MTFRFLTPDQHGLVDYAAAAGLIIAPFALGLGDSHIAAKWIAVATGVVVILVSLVTDYRLAVARVLPFRLHLAADLAVAFAFLAIPASLGFSGLDEVYYYANAVAVLIVVGVSAPDIADTTSSRRLDG